MNNGVGSQFVGGLMAFGMGVIIVAAIYQLNNPSGNAGVGAGVAGDVAGLGNNTLGALFK